MAASSKVNYRQMNEDLIMGYMKKTFSSKYAQSYPLALNNIIFSFLGNMFLRFDFINDALAEYIGDDGRSFKYTHNNDHFVNTTGDKFVVASSYAMNEGVTIIDIQTLDEVHGDAIGLISTLDEIKECDWIYYIQGYKYWWYEHTGIFAEKDRESTAEDFDYYEKWKINDIITLKVDCDDWKVTFYHNHKELHTMPLQPNEDYHLIYVAQSAEIEYRLL